MYEPRRCILYARKSTDREDKQILSIPAQLEELRRFAAREGMIIERELTEHCSAREPGRPVFSDLLTQVAQGKVERILAWKLDRVARNPIDGGALIHYLGKGLIKELVTPDGTYTGNGDSKFMLSVLFGAATKMTDDLSVGVKRGNRAVWERGRITAVPPLGYMKVRDRPGYRGAGKTMPDPERFPLMQELWRRVLNGMPVAEAWRIAVGDGLTARATRRFPDRAPSVQHIYKCLRNPFYTGHIVHETDVYAGEHTPMVTDAEFRSVQALLARSVEAPRPSKHEFLYTGLLHCTCGRFCIGELIKGRYVYYRCGRRREGRPRCHEPAPSESAVTASFEKSLGRLALDDALVDWSLEALNVWRKTSESDEARRATALDRRLSAIDLNVKRITDLAVAGHLETDEYVERKTELLAERRSVAESIQCPNSDSLRWEQAVRDVLTRSGQFLSGFQEAPNDSKRELLHELYENCVVKDRIVTPVLRFPFTVLGDARPDSPAASKGDANYPAPAKIVQSVRKNARPRSRRERAFHAWWARLREVRTPIVTQRDLSTCEGGTFSQTRPC